MKDFDFVMIYVIRTLLVLLENHLNYLQDYISKSVSKKYNTLLLEKKFFSKYLTMKSLSPEKENIIKPVTNLLRLKKEQTYTAIKDIRKLFTRKKK